MTTVIERFKRRKAILKQAAPTPTPLTAKQKKALANQPVDMEFVNAPSAADEMMKPIKELGNQIAKMSK